MVDWGAADRAIQSPKDYPNEHHKGSIPGCFPFCSLMRIALHLAYQAQHIPKGIKIEDKNSRPHQNEYGVAPSSTCGELEYFRVVHSVEFATGAPFAPPYIVRRRTFIPLDLAAKMPEKIKANVPSP